MSVMRCRMVYVRDVARGMTSGQVDRCGMESRWKWADMGVVVVCGGCVMRSAVSECRPRVSHWSARISSSRCESGVKWLKYPSSTFIFLSLRPGDGGVTALEDEKCSEFIGYI